MIKNNKRIIVCIFAIIAFVIFNPIKAKGANNNCTVMEDYYFMEAFRVTQNSDGTYNLTPVESSSDTTFKTPSGAFTDISISNPRVFTETDCENYYENYEERHKAGIDDDEAYCNDSTCTNSGNGMPYVGYNNAVNQSSCSTMVNNQVNYDEVDITINGQVEGQNEVSVTIDREYTVTAEQQENFYTDENGDMWLFQPVAVTVEMSYETAEECKNKPEPQVACAASSSDSYTFSGCSGSSHTATINANLQSSYYRSTINTKFSDEALSAEFCPGKIVEEQAVASVNIKQSGSLNVFLDTTKYSGGGVGFSFNYSTNAVWEYCGEYSTEKHAYCARKFYMPKCPSGYSLNTRTKQCEYTETDTEKVCEKYDKYGRCEKYKCLKTDANGNCTKYETREIEILYTENYTCQITSVGASSDRCYDQSVADAKIYEAAGNKLKSVSSPTAQSYDSNVIESKTNPKTVSLTENGAGNGSASGASGGSWPVGSMRYGSLSFSINQACINIYEPFDTIYTSNSTSKTIGGECGEDRVSGGNRYYIPIKWPESLKFKFWGSAGNVSIVDGMNWGMSFECGVNTEQKIYEDPPDVSLRYKFIYRPIDLNDPFPTVINGDRGIGSNWVYFMSQKNAVNQEMNRKNLEYHKLMTHEYIDYIRNDVNTSAYDTLKTIDRQGKSTILGEYLGITIENQNKYNALGECTNECW